MAERTPENGGAGLGPCGLACPRAGGEPVHPSGRLAGMGLGSEGKWCVSPFISARPPCPSRGGSVVALLQPTPLMLRCPAKPGLEARTPPALRPFEARLRLAPQGEGVDGIDRAAPCTPSPLMPSWRECRSRPRSTHRAFTL